jgi:PEP-CTERM motif
MRIASLALLCLALMLPASAQVLYDDGPINGTTDAWTINFGYVVGDTFILFNNSTVTGFNFGVWEFPGDVLTSVDWSVTSQFDSGTMYGSGTASGSNLSDQFISLNQYGYDIDKITVTGLNLSLNSGTTYWLNLQNAKVPSGNPVYWDENDGVGCKGDDGHGGGCPSEADWTGCISGGPLCPPESFDINGTGGGSTPEPSSIMLFGSGILGLAGLLRRTLF